VALSNLAPLRRELASALPQRPFAVRFWDGSTVPATQPGGPTFEIHSPQALVHVLRAPGELGLGRAYVLGLIDTDDIEGALRVVDTFEAPSISPAQIARLGVAVIRATGLVKPRAARPQSSGSPASATRPGATATRSATTTTPGTSSSPCSWIRR
jgi:cyclopropane-fatty-acyl-phospholipid synthase